ncbi:MAG: cobalamin-binding protein [Firmicutes bacterium]|nr:cobalamin-binding protein [Bacillota bacterium]
MFDIESNVYGFIKPTLDAHTLGIHAVAELLEDCGYRVIIAGDVIARAMDDYRHETKRKVVVEWILSSKINQIGLSYRLDHSDAVNMIGFLINELKINHLLSYQGGPIKSIFFGGLPEACEMIEAAFSGLVKTFIGGESVRETLIKMDVPEMKIPRDIIRGSLYDDERMEFGKKIIDSQEYCQFMPVDRSGYLEYGTKKDTVVKRIAANLEPSFAPLIRAHAGSYSSSISRTDSVKEFISWSKILADTKYLDILSIGSSQLTQSNFGEVWEGKTNGGGVPINSPEEYQMIWDASRPLLVRTYAGTKNVPSLAQMHERTLNTCWHALSLWWFNQLDERGPYDLYTNLKQHIDTLKYIAKTDKPFEPNVAHHFSFRGADDVTYIVAAYLSAKLAKKYGIKKLILQNMLNTPKLTWGIQDLAKSRAMIKLIKGLENANFSILLQPRAGLDYFKPNMDEAKMQLAAVTALMDDIDPHNESSPPIVHVVSYSEASNLATPEIINESIQITQYSLQEYRKFRRNGKVEDMSKNEELQERMNDLFHAARAIIFAIETVIYNPYSAEGFYKIFSAGFLPVPYLWREVEEFKYAKAWKTRQIKGSVKIVDEENKPMKTEQVLKIAINNIHNAEYNLKQRITKNLK